ncbi:hypothetical protein [Psychroserpens sp. MEBiC05023]
MKKPILLILILSLIFSCTSDDENESFDTTQILGVWEFNDTTFNLSDGSEIEQWYAICGEQLILKINENQTIETITSHTDNCLPMPSSNFPYISWEYLNNRTFRFSRMDTSDQSILTIQFEITFPTENTMKWNLEASGLVDGISYDSLEYNLTKQ